MNNLTKYNQKLLAIIGTGVIAAASLGLLAGIGGAVVTLVDFGSDNDSGIRVQNHAAVDNETTEVVRSQEITFGNPIQLDTAKPVFVIPVGQVNLEKEERINLESGSSFKFSGSGYKYRSQYGLFNNFIYYNHSKSLKKQIFNERVALTRWVYIKQDSIEALLFKGTNSDDNNDKQLNNNDYQSLFAYFINDDKLIKYNFDNKTVLNFDPLNKTNLIVIEVGIDKNKDFDFDRRSEPKNLITLNLSSRQINDLIPEKMKEDIQKTIDGVK